MANTEIIKQEIRNIRIDNNLIKGEIAILCKQEKTEQLRQRIIYKFKALNNNVNTIKDLMLLLTHKGGLE